MTRSTRMGLRSALVLAILVAIAQFAIPAHAATPSLSITPAAGPAGTVVTVTGTNFAPGERISLYYNNTLLTTSPAIVTVGTSGVFGASFTVPTMAPAAYSVAARGTTNDLGLAVFTETSPTITSVSLSKTVSVSGNAYTTSAAASQGASLQYAIAYTNTGTTTATNVVVTDTIGPGQILLSAPATSTNCVPTTPNSTTLMCSLGNVLPNTTARVFITTVVANGFAGAITNTARATSSNAVTVSSNTTTVMVGSPVIYANTLLCGAVTAYSAATALTGGTVTIGGVALTLAAGAATTNGVAIALNTTQCVQVAFNSLHQVTAYAVASNLTGLTYVCGTFAAGTTTTTLSVGGITLPNVVSTVGLVAGQYYCFVLNTSGIVYAVLTGIPTSITSVGSSPAGTGSRSYLRAAGKFLE